MFSHPTSRNYEVSRDSHWVKHLNPLSFLRFWVREKKSSTWTLWTKEKGLFHVLKVMQGVKRLKYPNPMKKKILSVFNTITWHTNIAEASLRATLLSWSSRGVECHYRGAYFLVVHKYPQTPFENFKTFTKDPLTSTIIIQVSDSN